MFWARLDPSDDPHTEERRLRRVSKDEARLASWFETAQVRLLTMRLTFLRHSPMCNCTSEGASKASEHGIHNHDREYGFRARAKRHAPE